MNLLHFVLLVTYLLLAPAAALAADAVRGRQLAQEHCGGCHAVGAGERREVADASPFSAIGRKYGFDPSALAAAILGPHPRMNFAPAPADAADLAAYIAALGR
ncbi:MAG: cytochrome c [Bradyrhizobiaceae bacterium]|nr:cytochrome c [Bradyrhizobiaceae bacterium]